MAKGPHEPAFGVQKIYMSPLLLWALWLTWYWSSLSFYAPRDVRFSSVLEPFQMGQH